MSDGPKLYNYKPRKAHLKHSRKEHQSSSPTPSSSSTMSSSSRPQGTSGGSPPLQPPKESFARRYKFMWPLLLAVNFTAGAYLFMRTKKRDVDEKGEVRSVPSESVSTTVLAATDTEKPSVPQPINAPKPRFAVPDEVQKELFKWILEEKRKLKPKDDAEKKRIEDEMALLKLFIRNKSPPDL